MTTPIVAKNSMSPRRRARGARDWLCLAASPAFAAMALISAGEPMELCGAGSGMALMNGMVSMYLLMSLFHLPPWLTLISRRDATPSPFFNAAEGD